MFGIDALDDFEPTPEDIAAMMDDQDALDYWQASDLDSPISLAPFDCCGQYTHPCRITTPAEE